MADASAGFALSVCDRDVLQSNLTMPFPILSPLFDEDE